MRTKLTEREKMARMIARHPEVAEMVRNDRSTKYIVKYGHVSTSTVTAMRRAIALTEGRYSSSHRNGFEYRY